VEAGIVGLDLATAPSAKLPVREEAPVSVGR